MLYYLSRIAYYRSPLEMRAYQKGSDTALEVAQDNNRFGAESEDDIKKAQRIKDKLHKIRLEFKNAERLTGITTTEICNLFLQYNYFNKLSQSNISYHSEALLLRNDIINLVERAYTNLKNGPVM